MINLVHGYMRAILFLHIIKYLQLYINRHKPHFICIQIAVQVWHKYKLNI